MLKANQLQMAVDFAYSGECELTFDNIQDVVETADFLGMDALIEGERLIHRQKLWPYFQELTSNHSVYMCLAFFSTFRYFQVIWKAQQLTLQEQPISALQNLNPTVGVQLRQLWYRVPLLRKKAVFLQLEIFDHKLQQNLRILGQVSFNDILAQDASGLHVANGFLFSVSQIYERELTRTKRDFVMATCNTVHDERGGQQTAPSNTWGLRTAGGSWRGSRHDAWRILRIC